jgi:hypothetical protein
MRSRNFKIGPLIACSFGLLVPNSFAGNTCSIESLEIKPSWISTLEVDQENNRILIADPKQQKLIYFDSRTSDMDGVPLPSNFAPASVTKIADGFFVQSRDTAAIITSDLKQQKVVNLQETKKRSTPELGSLYSSWITRGSVFVGFGSVYKGGRDVSRSARDFQLGFVRGKVSAATREFRDISLLEATDKNDFYLLGLPYFAATDDGLFYVRMIANSPVVIKRVNPTGPPTDVQAIPKEFRLAPFLDKRSSSPNSTAALFRQIESSTMVSGLFGQGKFLYLLTRKPDLSGGTEWLLHQIDPQKSRLLGAVRLPTKANHLSVAVSTGEWYFVERGEVHNWGDQDIENLIRVPRAWIAAPATSPLNADNTVGVACDRRGTK